MNSHVNSKSVATNVLDHIWEKMWEKVAHNNIHKMTPINVKLMNQYTFQSIAELSSKFIQLSDTIQAKQSLPTPNKEPMLEGFIPIDQKKKVQQMPSLASIKKSVRKRNKTKQSFISNQPSIIRQKTSKSTVFNQNLVPLKKQKGITVQTELSNDQTNLINESIEGFRKKMSFLEEQQNLEAENQKKLESQQTQRSIRLKKKLKQIQKISYDYSGQFFSSKSISHNSTLSGAVELKTTLKTPKRLDNSQSKMHERMKTVIQNQKLLERKEKIKNQKIFTEANQALLKESGTSRFLNAFKDDDVLSEGVRLEEKLSNFSKENVRLKKGLNLNLNQFQKQFASRKFKQFTIKTKKQLETSNQDTKIQKYKQGTVQKGKVTVSEDTGSGRKLKTMNDEKYSSALSRSILSQQMSKKRGQVKVSNTSLFESFFSENCEQQDIV